MAFFLIKRRGWYQSNLFSITKSNSCGYFWIPVIVYGKYTNRKIYWSNQPLTFYQWGADSNINIHTQSIAESAFLLLIDFHCRNHFQKLALVEEWLDIVMKKSSKRNITCTNDQGFLKKHLNSIEASVLLKLAPIYIYIYLK